MGFLGYWTVTIILYQTFICIIISWLILGCKLPPTATELHEITLIKFLYVYDPQACGRVYFYNYTKKVNNNKIASTVIWPVKNQVASRFRSKITLWLYLHVVWAILCFATLGLRQRPCGLYMALLPFTAAGVTLLVVDVVFAVLFLMEAEYTSTEVAILGYVNSRSNTDVYSIKRQSLWPQETSAANVEDTSWVALLMAYCSAKAIVQWVINFWLVKDNYFHGLDAYRKLHHHHKRVPLTTSEY